MVVLSKRDRLDRLTDMPGKAACNGPFLPTELGTFERVRQPAMTD
jgi:hypothetical protein